jgi:pimeloyl-ACP methyl ester carboxylesterase/protein-tyrosine phosphatase
VNSRVKLSLSNAGVTMGNREVVVWSALMGAIAVSTIYLFRRSSSASKSAINKGGFELDDSILRQNSFVGSHPTYASIRQFYRPHAQRGKLSEIDDLPLLVFIHGLGGNLHQFVPLLSSLVHIAPCFGLELPGHGVSAFQPTDYDAYTIEAFAALWQVSIERICEQHGHSKLVFIGHSMGSSIAAMLATKPGFDLDVVGIVAICPKGRPPPEKQCIQARRFLSLPDIVLDILRWFDRRGRLNSPSVRRFVGSEATEEDKRKQLIYNENFTTPVWKRSATGLLPHYNNGIAHGGIPGHEVWSQIRTPILLVAGEADKVTKPEEATDIVSYLQNKSKSQDAAPMPVSSESVSEETSHTSKADLSLTEQRFSINNLILKTAILPSPAGHALLYTHKTSHVVAGLIEDFLASYVDSHLSQTWQLQQVSTPKWDEVKNLPKWKATRSVSGPIPSPNSTAQEKNIFRALKTLREQDEEHTPRRFVEAWGHEIAAVVDISHDAPVYDTKKLEEGGISYSKEPSVSKVPPSPREVEDFITLVDRLRKDIKARGLLTNDGHHKAIGVHCHYGYNRTGFLICSYLIQRCKMDVEDALEEFAKAKPPGIKHQHFVDALYVRHVKGLQKGKTWKLEG